MGQIKDAIQSKGLSTEFTQKLIDAEPLFYEIYKECNNSFRPGDGSYLFLGGTYEYSVEMHAKQELLYEQSKKSHSVLEIGTYMGHSLLIMLLANPNLNIASVDLNDQYARPSIEVLKRHFPKANISFYHGNSLDVLPKISDQRFDLFHIDGQHLESHISQEVDMCKNMSNYKVLDRNAMRIIFDDIHCCEALIKNISENSEMISHIIPDCIWRNSYLEFYIKD